MEYEQILIMPAHPKTRAMTWIEYVPPVLLWVLPDDLVPLEYRKERPAGIGVPATCQLITAVQTIRMTRELSYWLYDLNPGLPASAFAGMFNAWVPGDESEVGEDNYITNINFAGDDSRYFCHITFEGNVLKAKSPKPFLQNNKMVWEVESINYLNLPDPATLPAWLRTHLTVIRPDIYTDPLTGVSRQRVNPFPLGSRENPRFVAPLSAAPLFIEDARVRVVDYLPSPYWPE